MEYGFFRVACASPNVTVADCAANTNTIIEDIRSAAASGAEFIVFPELCITGYTCGDLFLQRSLQTGAIRALEYLAKQTANEPLLSVVGLPVAVGNALYNCAAFIQSGRLLALVPKTHIPNYGEFYEVRHFSAAPSKPAEDIYVSEAFPAVPFGTDILITDTNESAVSIAAEICEDLWVPQPPSIQHVLAGATVIANLSASNEIIGKAAYRKLLVTSQSARTVSAYLYADAGHGESTQDMIFAGHNLIAENGTVLAESELFADKMTFADIDIERLCQERRRMNTFAENSHMPDTHSRYKIIQTRITGQDKNNSFVLKRRIDPYPFVPSDSEARAVRCRNVITLQAEGLAKRLRHIHAKTAVVGLSGGLDSTLALLVTCRAFDLCGLDRSGILAVTMPCFGTTDRTYTNACQLAEETGAVLKQIPIVDAVRQHFRDIGQDENIHDVTYENCQARERTQVLMDTANKTGGIVIGTGDLSELALGWATYNGDHMSMYGVNSSIPKTLVRYLVRWFADDAETNRNVKLSTVLNDILETPVSPELLPPTEGVISQKTEEIVGPYELHDFFLYYVLRFGFSPSKILYLAEHAFATGPTQTNETGRTGSYDRTCIIKWLRIFYRRFFAQQFKRSCMPDGAKVGTVNLSPRGDWRMPSDASSALWLSEIEGLK